MVTITTHRNLCIAATVATVFLAGVSAISLKEKFCYRNDEKLRPLIMPLLLKLLVIPSEQITDEDVTLIKELHLSRLDSKPVNKHLIQRAQARVATITPKA